MFEQYQTEILALVAILVLVVVYIIVKKRQRNSDEPAEEAEFEENTTQELSQIELEEPQEAIEDTYDTEPTTITQEDTSETTEIKEDNPKEDDDKLDGSEEGSFGDTPKQRQQDTIDTIEPKHLIPKRAVPAHGKITKDNFKEFKGTRILVAEDNLINQKVIRGLLADTGVEITMADDGQECLDILEKDKDFLLVLMDAHMPRVDGFEATRAIRANPDYAKILVVALSGDTAADDIKKMTEAGMSEHLEKPLRMEALYDIFYAYTAANTPDEDEDEFVNVVMTKELNGDQGLEICGGDEGFYHEILDEFVNTYENSTQELGDLLRAGELQAADRLLLDLVGVTANIGAENLNSISHIIKASLGDTTEKSYLTLVEQYKTSLDNLIVDIKEYN